MRVKAGLCGNLRFNETKRNVHQLRQLRERFVSDYLMRGPEKQVSGHVELMLFILSLSAVFESDFF